MGGIGINKLFCKGASGAIVVGDITDQESIENTANWKKHVGDNMITNNYKQSEFGKTNDEDDNEPPETIPMLLALNKYDLVDELVNSGH